MGFRVRFGRMDQLRKLKAFSFDLDVSKDIWRRRFGRTVRGEDGMKRCRFGLQLLKRNVIMCFSYVGLEFEGMGFFFLLRQHFFLIITNHTSF